MFNKQGTFLLQDVWPKGSNFIRDSSFVLQLTESTEILKATSH